jgi:hypothetical protein
METFEWNDETYRTYPEILKTIQRTREAKGEQGVEVLVAYGLRNGRIFRDKVVPEEPTAGFLIMDASELPFDVRIEMMVGRMSDHLADTLELSKRIKVRANASHSTRSQLASIAEIQFLVLKETEALQREVASLRRQLDERPS